MNIVENRLEPEKVDVTEIPAGDVFRIGDHYYIMASRRSDKYLECRDLTYREGKK